MEVTPEMYEDPDLGLYYNLGSKLEIGILLALWKDINGEFDGRALVYFPTQQQKRDNVYLTFQGVSQETFMGMLPDVEMVSDDIFSNVENIKGGFAKVKKPIGVVVGFVNQGQGLILSYLPADLRRYFSEKGGTIEKPFRKIKPGEPYVRGKSRSSILMQQDGTTTFRLDDSLQDGDANQLIIRIDSSRNVSIINANQVTANAKNFSITGAEQISLSGDEVLVGSDASKKLVTAEELTDKINTHVHTSAAPGDPTSAPVTPFVVDDYQTQKVKAI